MHIKELAKLGLTEGEVRLYSALLEMGETTRTELARKSGISPSKIYDVANRLLEKGIISSVRKSGVIHFSPADPHRLADFVAKKQEDIEQEKQLVSSLLPALISQYKDIREKTDIEVFYGWDGLKTAFLSLENSMGRGDESLVFGASIGKDPKQADIFFTRHQQRVEKRGYKVRIIFNEDMRSRRDRYKYYVNHRIHQIRFLYQTTFTELYIYKDRVLFLMLLKKPIAIVVWNSEAVASFRQFFETMWKLAKR